MTFLFPTPVVYDGNDARFLQRDGARFSQTLKQCGGIGIKVILAKDGDVSQPVSPILRTGTWNQWMDSSFWKSFEADGALCYFGFASKRFLPVVSAMKQAGIPLALKMDSALGLYEFPHYFSTEFRRAYWYGRQSSGPLGGLANAVRRAFGPAVKMDSSRIIRFIEAFDVLTAESPLARDNTIHWLIRRGRNDLAKKVVLLHHPVPDRFVPPEPERKSNRALAVTLDWDNPLKGGSILEEALRSFLKRHETWSATIVGRNSKRFARLQTEFGARIELFPALSADELIPNYQSSKILCIASGSESGPIVAFEALACGCSLVFSPAIPQLGWTVDAGIGTLAKSRTPGGIAVALESESNAWLGHPERMASIVAASPPLHATEILEHLMRHLSPRKDLAQSI